MSQFLPEYAEEMNVTICTVVTDLALHSGEGLLMEFGKGFGLEIGWKNH